MKMKMMFYKNELVKKYKMTQKKLQKNNLIL